MSAQLTVNSPLTTNQTNVNALQFNNLVENASITGVGSGVGEIAANVIATGETFQTIPGNAPASGPALRALIQPGSTNAANEAQAGNQLILPAPNGKQFKLTIDNNGSWVITPL
jgi:hypothetical protein